MVAVGLGHLPMAEEEASTRIIRAPCTRIIEPEEYFKLMHFFANSQDGYSADAAGQRPFPVSLHLFGDLKRRADEVARVIISYEHFCWRNWTQMPGAPPSATSPAKDPQLHEW